MWTGFQRVWEGGQTEGDRCEEEQEEEVEEKLQLQLEGGKVSYLTYLQKRGVGLSSNLYVIRV